MWNSTIHSNIETNCSELVVNMTEYKLVHFTILDGNEDEIKSFAGELNKWKKKRGIDYDFLVTNDRYQLTDVKYLLNELYRLYKNFKAVKDGEKNAKE